MKHAVISVIANEEFRLIKLCDSSVEGIAFARKCAQEVLDDVNDVDNETLWKTEDSLWVSEKDPNEYEFAVSIMDNMSWHVHPFKG